MTVRQELVEVFQDVFDDDSLQVTRETTAEDIADWDSVMHVTLMLAVERAFGLRFTSADISSLKNVGELEDLVNQRVAAK